MASIFGTAEGAIVGGSVGIGVAAAVEPVVEPARQDVWKANPYAILDPLALARLVAQGIVPFDAAADQAQRNGFNSNKFRALVETVKTSPGLADLDQMANRGLINRGNFDHALKKHQIEPMWYDALWELLNDRLSLAEVANAVQQGHLPNPGVLPEIDPTIIFPPDYSQGTAPDNGAPSNVPLTTIDLDPLEEAAASGWDLSRVQVQANLSGLPPGADTLLQMWNKNLITEEAVDAGLREGHLKTKWAHAFKRNRWHVLTPQEYAGLWLRGWITKQQAHEGGALTGTTPDQIDLMYKNRGRPMAPVQAFTAWARKAPHPVGEGIPDRAGTFDKQDFARAIQQSDIRTEYIEPLWAIRYAYPSLFQVNRLVTAGSIDPATGDDWLEKQRYAPEVRTALAKSWTNGGTAPKHPNVVKAQNQLWTATHKAYLNHDIDDATATGELTAIHADPSVIPDILALWKRERDLQRKTLTAAQIKKAWAEPAINAATGANWTLDEAIAALVDLGYSVTDAESYLNI